MKVLWFILIFIITILFFGFYKHNFDINSYLYFMTNQWVNNFSQNFDISKPNTWLGFLYSSSENTDNTDELEKQLEEIENLIKESSSNIGSGDVLDQDIDDKAINNDDIESTWSISWQNTEDIFSWKKENDIYSGDNSNLDDFTWNYMGNRDDKKTSNNSQNSWVWSLTWIIKIQNNPNKTWDTWKNINLQNNIQSWENKTPQKQDKDLDKTNDKLNLDNYKKESWFLLLTWYEITNLTWEELLDFRLEHFLEQDI